LGYKRRLPPRGISWIVEQTNEISSLKRLRNLFFLP
jgi:hypothetical protein